MTSASDVTMTSWARWQSTCAHWSSLCYCRQQVGFIYLLLSPTHKPIAITGQLCIFLTVCLMIRFSQNCRDNNCVEFRSDLQFYIRGRIFTPVKWRVLWNFPCDVCFNLQNLVCVNYFTPSIVMRASVCGYVGLSAYGSLGYISVKAKFHDSSFLVTSS